MNKKARIFEELAMLSAAYEKPQSDERLKIYVEELVGFDFNSVIGAIRDIKRTSEFFPSLSKIIEKVQSPNGSTEEMAVAIANEIIESISKFGHTNLGEARASLGVDKWGIVERAGGWMELCKIEYSELPAVRAQIRELAKAYINRSKREFTGGDFRINSSPVQVGNNTGLKKLEVSDVQ